MKIQWTEPATADLQAIFNYISADAPLYARMMMEKILEAVDLLENFPERGRRVPEAARPDIRQIWVSPFRIIYRTAPEKVVVLAIVHGRRDWDALGPRPWETE